MLRCANRLCNRPLDGLHVDERGVVQCRCKTEYTLSREQLAQRKQPELPLGEQEWLDGAIDAGLVP